MSELKFDENPYYSPQLCGLDIFESIDTADSYEFDMFVIWRKLDDNTLWWDTDSGCSCPSPFDNGDHGHSLKPITPDTLYNFDEALKNHSGIDIQDYLKISKKVKDFIAQPPQKSK
jgi:hypothetical protein